MNLSRPFGGKLSLGQVLVCLAAKWSEWGWKHAIKNTRSRKFCSFTMWNKQVFLPVFNVMNT